MSDSPTHLSSLVLGYAKQARLKKKSEESTDRCCYITLKDEMEWKKLRQSEMQ